jgi:hypothetical protein
MFGNGPSKTVMVHPYQAGAVMRRFSTHWNIWIIGFGKKFSCQTGRASCIGATEDEIDADAIGLL